MLCGSILSSRQFSSRRRTLRRGQQDIFTEIWDIWFWLRLSSMTWSSPTASGMLRIWFLERSSTSRCRRLQSGGGSARSWFPERLRVLRADSCPKVDGSSLKWLLFRLSVSSFFRLHNSSGRTVSLLLFKERLFSRVNFPIIIGGRLSILLLDKSMVLRLLVSFCNSEGNSVSPRSLSWKTPVFCAVSTWARRALFPILAPRFRSLLPKPGSCGTAQGWQERKGRTPGPGKKPLVA